jgi:drug/metabolite transporter (DMT)-like permease
MNSTQIAGMVTTLLGFLGGYAMAKGFSPEQWTAIVGGVAAAVAWGVDYVWNKNPKA